MDRETAVALIAEYLKYGQIMMRLVELSERLPPEDRRKILNADWEACFSLYE